MPSPQDQFKNLYAQMFSAIQAGDDQAADECRIKMETIRQGAIVEGCYPYLPPGQFPDFVKEVFNKNHYDLDINERSNCINAAFNFHFGEPVFTPYSPMDFLSTIQHRFNQIQFDSKLEWGDLVVLWSRSGDQWRDRRIVVGDLKPEIPGFPFGLVFDHVAVYVGENRLFHKPDPTLSSRYQINRWDDVVGFNEGLPGFELTYHRKK